MHDDKGYCALVLTAGRELTDGSVYSGIVSAGMQRGKSRLSPSRTDKSYLYPPHLSPSTPDTENKLKGCREMGERDESGKMRHGKTLYCEGFSYQTFPGKPSLLGTYYL